MGMVGWLLCFLFCQAIVVSSRQLSQHCISLLACNAVSCRTSNACIALRHWLRSSLKPFCGAQCWVIVFLRAGSDHILRSLCVVVQRHVTGWRRPCTRRCHGWRRLTNGWCTRPNCAPPKPGARCTRADMLPEQHSRGARTVACPLKCM